MVSVQRSHAVLAEALGHHNAGRWERAEALYRQLAAVAPRTPGLFEAWGRLAERRGRADEAARCYTQAWQLNPASIPATTRLARVLTLTGRAANAESLLRQILRQQPDSGVLWNHLAHAMKVQGRMAEALEYHEKAVVADPTHAPSWTDYGLTLGAFGRNVEAIEKQDRALELNPAFVAAHFGRAQSLHKVYRLEEALAEYDWVLRAEPNHLEARSFRLFTLQNLPHVTREQLFADHCAYGGLVGRGTPATRIDDPSPERRLRVGILSPDLRTHSCAYFLEPLLKHLDPAQFELYLYHDHFHVDATSHRLQGYAATWRNFVAQACGHVERVIRADRPDILIDLTGHIGNSIRLPVFANRVAPVQITYLGYPDTTGVPAMDFRFTDAIADPPPEGDAFATEKLVRFAPVAWAYQPPDNAPPVVPPPAAAGASLTFGCFNSATKFSAPLFEAWARILAAVPGAKLLLKGRDFEDRGVRDYMLGRMAAAALPTDRIELLPRADSTTDHLRLYGRIDVALDSFPYNGTTTTCEALWMGRPVITVRGNRHAARVGTSLLTAVGHPEWVGADVDDYVRIAVMLAGNPATVGAASASLRDAMRGSPLMDHRGQAARFAAALRECWRSRLGQLR